MNSSDLTAILSEALQIASTLSIQERTTAFQSIQSQLADRSFRVAFVGQFKTGKSTLINKFILKENLLFTDFLEATSVPTEIEFGSPAQLEVFEFERTSTSYHLDDSHTVSDSVINGIRLAETIPNPTPEIIKSRTSADSPDERSALAKRVSHVRLRYPSPALEGITIVDTPGINSTTEAVVTTTYRIIPSCDLTILVIHPKTLTKIETEFLQSQVFAAGISHCLIAINYDSRFLDDDISIVEKIKKEIESHLFTIGRSSIPVCIVEASKGTQTSFSLNAESAPATPVTISEKNADFESFLLAYIRDNIQNAKIQKVKNNTAKQIQLLQSEIEIELNALKKSDEDRQRALEDAQDAKRLAEIEFRQMENSFFSELQMLLISHRSSLLSALSAQLDSFLSQLDGISSFNNLPNFLDESKKSFDFEIENIVLTSSKELTDTVADLQNRYSARWELLTSPWEKAKIGIDLSGSSAFSTITSLPPFLFTSADTLLSSLLGMLISFVGRIKHPIAIALTQAPALLGIDLSTIIFSTLKGHIISSIREQSKAVIPSIETTIRETNEAFYQSIKTQWQENFATQQNSLLAPIARAANEENETKRSADLQNALTQVMSLKNKL